MKYKWVGLFIVLFALSFSYLWFSEKDLFNVAWKVDGVNYFSLYDFNGDGTRDIVTIEEYATIKILDSSSRILFEEEINTGLVRDMETKRFIGNEEEVLLIWVSEAPFEHIEFYMLSKGNMKRYTSNDIETLSEGLAMEDIILLTGLSDFHSSPWNVKIIDTSGKMLWQKDFDFDVFFVVSHDLDNDGNREIIVLGEITSITRNYEIFVYDRQGDERWHYRSQLNGVVRLEVFDIDRDGNSEILFGAGWPGRGGKLVCLDGNGDVLWESSIDSGIWGIYFSRIEGKDVILVLSAAEGNSIYGLDVEGRHILKKNTGDENTEYINDLLVLDVDGDRSNEILFSQQFLKLINLDGSERKVSNELCYCDYMESEDFDNDGDIDVVATSLDSLMVFANSTHFGKLDMIWMKGVIFKTMILILFAYLLFLPIVEYRLLEKKFKDNTYFIILLSVGSSFIVYGIGNILHYLIYESDLNRISLEIYGVNYVIEIVRENLMDIVSTGFGLFTLFVCCVAYLLTRNRMRS